MRRAIPLVALVSLAFAQEEPRDEKAKLTQEKYWEVSKDTGEAGDTGWWRRPDDAFPLAGPYHNTWSLVGETIYTIREVKGENILWEMDPKRREVASRIVLPKEYAPIFFSSTFQLQGKLAMAGLKDCLIYDLKSRESRKVQACLLYNRGKEPLMTTYTHYDSKTQWLTAVVDNVSEKDCRMSLLRFRLDDPEKVIEFPLPRDMTGAEPNPSGHDHMVDLLGVMDGMAVIKRGLRTTAGMKIELWAVDVAKQEIVAKAECAPGRNPMKLSGEASSAFPGKILMSLRTEIALLDPRTLEMETVPVKVPAWESPPTWFFTMEGVAVLVSTTGNYVLFDPKSYEMMGSGVFLPDIVGGLNSIGKSGDKLFVFQCDYGKQPDSDALRRTKAIRDHFLLFKLEKKLSGDK